MLVVQHGFLLELVWITVEDDSLAKRITQCHADKRSVKLNDWVSGEEVEVKLREVACLMVGVAVYAILVAFAIIGPVVAGCLISIKDNWALGLCRMLYLWMIAFLAIICPVVGLDYLWDAGITSLIRKTKERVLLRKMKSLSRVRVTQPCMQIFAKVFWRKMCSCSEKSNYTSDCCTVLESILADEVNGIRVVDICGILQEDSESSEPMRSSLRRELVRKLDVAVDQYLARQTAEKDAEEWRLQQAGDAERREREAEHRIARGLTTVREQHAAFMLGFDDPSDADMLALLERVSESEELRKLRSRSESCPPFRRTEDA